MIMCIMLVRIMRYNSFVMMKINASMTRLHITLTKIRNVRKLNLLMSIKNNVDVLEERSRRLDPDPTTYKSRIPYYPVMSMPKINSIIYVGKPLKALKQFMLTTPLVDAIKHIRTYA